MVARRSHLGERQQRRLHGLLHGQRQLRRQGDADCDCDGRERGYTSYAFSASAIVTGLGTIASSSDPSLTFTYYVGSGTSGTSLGDIAPTNVGTYTVVAHFAGNANYFPADSNPVPHHRPGDAGGDCDGRERHVHQLRLPRQCDGD